MHRIRTAHPSPHSDHPLRAVKSTVEDSLRSLNGLFNEIYADTGRASIAPEKLLRALLLQVFYSVRSERMLMEQIRYNMLLADRGLVARDVVRPARPRERRLPARIPG